MPYDIGVVGLDDFNGRQLGRLKGADDCRFHAVITREETVIHDPDYPFEARLETARRRIREIGGIDGIMTYWDFPSSSFAALLAEEFDLPYATPEAVLKCEHKLWFREEQAMALETPRFSEFNPFDDAPLKRIGMDFPFWVKPVVGHSSMLGFEIRDERDFEHALGHIRDGIRELTQPFAYLIDHVGLPEHLVEEGADLCLAEELISEGDQCTVEGYVKDGEVVCYGLIDSIRFEDGHTFHHYAYPSTLPEGVRARIADTTTQLVRQLGYDRCPFNVEFFYDRERDTISVLEMNARLSQSHVGLFSRVDGRPHFQIAVDLALGRTPQWETGGGDFACAGKYYLRKFEDAIVERVPSDDNLEALHARYPDADLAIGCQAGDRLSQLPEQAPNSYFYAELFIGADDEDALQRKYEDCLDLLDFEFGAVDGTPKRANG